MNSPRIRSAVTISLVTEAAGGPFVYWGDLEGNAARAKAIGFDAIEVFAPSADVLDRSRLRAILDTHQLQLAALGTGAGWVIHRLSLTHPDATVRQKALVFIQQIIDAGAPFGAPAILGSMQGRFEGSVSKPQAMEWLAQALEVLGAHAEARGTTFLYEPLNRYETNLINRIEDGVAFLESLRTRGVKLLVDLFHANIEEADTAAAIRKAGRHVGHVHFVDNHRRAAGTGQMRYAPIVDALREIGYQGYLSAEAFSQPDADAAARQTYAAFRQLLPTP